MSPKQISKMPLAERLQTMEALWDSLGESRTTLPSPSWHRPVLEGRRKKIEQGKAKFMPLAQVKAALAR